VSTVHPQWPHQQLDVRALRESGIRPQPFRQFVLKIHSRCNLACSYCYVYEMADQSWRQQPLVMSTDVVYTTVARIAEHARSHDLRHVRLVLHGGEPLLAGVAFIEDLACRARAELGTAVAADLVVQTNGTCLDDAMLTMLRLHGIRVGVSIDGDRTATDRNRRYHGGRSSYDAVTAALEILQTDRYRAIYAGLLCTISLENDPVHTYEALLRYAPPMIDFLLPHGTWSAPPPRRLPDAATPYADWLLKVFARWTAAPRQETSIRLFNGIISQLLGGPSTTEVIGLHAADTLVIETDGSIKQIDALSAAYENAADTGLCVTRHPLDSALDHPTTVARQIGLAALSSACQECAVRDVCGGGFYPHRYRSGDGFRNPSVYCADLLRLITTIREYVLSEGRRLTGT
jgi:uncharacterized protein